MTVTETRTPHYVPPSWFTRSVFNRFVAWSTRRGLSLWGSRVLEVRGRKTGEWRSVPVNLLTHDDSTYLVAPRGETQWVRNLRVAGEGRLRVGGRRSTFSAREIDPSEALEVLRAYLKRWKWEVGQFFDGVGPDASEAELAAAAVRHPVFAVTIGRAVS